MCWEKRPVCPLPGRASSSFPEPVPLGGFSGFHRSEQTSLPWLTRFLSACWKSSSLCLAGLTTHHRSWACSKTLWLSTQTVHALPCGCSFALFQFEALTPGPGLLSCPGAACLPFHRASLERKTLSHYRCGDTSSCCGGQRSAFPPLLPESRGHRQPAHKGSLCKMTSEPENPPSRALRVIRLTIPINWCDRHA